MVKKSGFSLIELTVVIGLLSLLILAIVSTMLITMVSSNRVRTAAKVKQAGNYAVNQIQSLVRNAKLITFCDPAVPTLTILSQDGATTQLFLDTTAQIASNSGVYLTPTGLTTSSFTLTCDPSVVEPTLIKVSFDLSDTLTPSGVNNPLLHFETSINLRNE